MSQVLGEFVTPASSPDVQKIPKNIPARVRWLYMALPTRWMFVETAEGFEFLPQLGKLKIDPGVGGVLDGGDTTAAEVMRAKKGWIIIRPNDPRLGDRRHRVVKKFPHATGKPFYTDASEEVDVVAGRLYPTEGGEDYYEFLRDLVTSGIVPPIHPMVLKAELEEQRSKVERRESMYSQNPANAALAARVEKEKKLLAAMEAHQVAAPPKPKRKRAPRKPKAEPKQIGPTDGE